MTGSGKTYTLTGTKEEQGIAPRVAKYIFDTLDSRRERFNSRQNERLREVGDEVTLSCLEIYQERLVDLLMQKQAVASASDLTRGLRIRENKKLGIWVEV